MVLIQLRFTVRRVRKYWHRRKNMSILFPLSHLVVEVDEQGRWRDPDDDEPGPVVVVDGVDRVLAEPGNPGVRGNIKHFFAKKY